MTRQMCKYFPRVSLQPLLSSTATKHPNNTPPPESYHNTRLTQPPKSKNTGPRRNYTPAALLDTKLYSKALYPSKRLNLPFLGRPTKSLFQVISVFPSEWF